MKPGAASAVMLALAIALPIAARAADPTDLRVDRGPRMRYPRVAHTATLLRSGKVLFAGGSGPAATLTELYDPIARSFEPHAKMRSPRVGHTATLLREGRVLIVGGGLGTIPEAVAEIYDPGLRRFLKAASMANPRAEHTATLLSDGRVLVAGGDDGERSLAEAEIFDPRTGRFETVGRMTEPRWGHSASLLADGKVLVVGGFGFALRSLASAEIFDPATGGFSAIGTLSQPRRDHAAITLRDGRVLIVGGAIADTSGSRALVTAEIYDPSNGEFEPADMMSVARSDHERAVALLRDGRVLVAGNSKVIEIFDPAKGVFSELPDRLGDVVRLATMTLLPDGAVLIVGGTAPTANAWIVRPAR